MTIQTLIDLDLDGKTYRLVLFPAGRTAIDDQTRETHDGPCIELQLAGRNVWCAADRMACVQAAGAASAPGAFVDAIRETPGIPGDLTPVATFNPEFEEFANEDDGDEEDDLESLTFPELRARAKDLGLSAGGSAEELVARIREHSTDAAEDAPGAPAADVT